MSGGTHEATHAGFPTTRWSLVDRGQSALSEIFLAYRPALITFLVRTKGFRPDIAEDLVQGFVCDKLLLKDLLGQVDREKGRFRTFLIRVLSRYASNCARDARAGKRSPGRLSDLADCPEPSCSAPPPTTAFDVAWGRELLGRALSAMRMECESSHRPDVWAVFEERLLAPLMGTEPKPTYEELVARYDLASPSRASNLLITGKRMFRRLLRDEIRLYVRSEEEIDEEIRDLMAILSDCRA